MTGAINARSAAATWGAVAVFQVVWLACAWSASHGHPAVGMIAAVLAATVHVARAPAPVPTLIALVACGTLGFVAESLLVAAGLVQYASPWPSVAVAPAWVAALWLAFGTTLEATRRLLQPLPLAAVTVVGACVGPLSYVAGERLGALRFGAPLPTVLMGIAGVWAAVLPLLLRSPIGRPCPTRERSDDREPAAPARRAEG